MEEIYDYDAWRTRVPHYEQERYAECRGCGRTERADAVDWDDLCPDCLHDLVADWPYVCDICDAGTTNGAGWTRIWIDSVDEVRRGVCPACRTTPCK